MNEKKEDPPKNHDKVKIEDLKYSYDRALDIFKLNNDNYFKRVQIIMVVLQAGLFIALLKLLESNLDPDAKFILSILIMAFGLAVAHTWKKLINRQIQYLELQKRYLRNIEMGFVGQAIPVDYFSIESAITKQIPIDLASAMIKEYKVNNKGEEIKEGKEGGTIKKNNKPYYYAEFKWSGKRYPGGSEELDKIHKVGEARGGTALIERNLSRITFWLWFSLGIGLLYLKCTKKL